MFLNDVAHFLVANGALHTLVSGTTMLLLGGAVKLLRDLIRHQRETNRLLDPHTPGGLGDLDLPKKDGDDS